MIKEADNIIGQQQCRFTKSKSINILKQIIEDKINEYKLDTDMLFTDLTGFLIKESQITIRTQKGHRWL